MAVKTGLEKLMKQDLKKVLKSNGLDDKEVSTEMKLKPKGMYQMLREVFADKEIQESVKKMLPLGVEISGSDETLKITLCYGTIEGCMAIKSEMKLKKMLMDAVKGVQKNAEKSNCTKKSKCTCKKKCSRKSKK